MDEAKRLNMLDGHFFWLWLDASSEFDVFHNIANSTQYTEDNENDFASFRDKDEALHNDGLDRSKREDADNNSIVDVRYSLRDSISTMKSENVIREYFLNNNSKDAFFHQNDDFNAHINKKQLNFSNAYNISENDSSERLINYNVDKKGVESSKIENSLLEKEIKNSFQNSIIDSEISSSSKIDSESFNKYVNSIRVNNYNNAKILQEKYLDIHNKDKEIKDGVLFSSDISDFLMNPTVHTSMNNFRDKIVKRVDKYVESSKNIFDSTNENKSTIFNDLPIGLLALYPQPMVIGKKFLIFFCNGQ